MLKVLGTVVLLILLVYGAFYLRSTQKAAEYFGGLESTGTAIIKPLQAEDPDILTYRYPEQDFPELRSSSQKIPTKLYAERINAKEPVDLVAESVVDTGGKSALMILVKTSDGKLGYAHGYELASKDGSRLEEPPRL